MACKNVVIIPDMVLTPPWHRDAAKSYDGMKEALEELNVFGQTLYVVTDDTTEDARAMVSRLGFDGLFKGVYGMNPGDKDIIDVIARMQTDDLIHRSDTVFVCGMPEYAEIPVRSGYPAVAAFWEKESDREQLRKAGASWFVHDPEMLSRTIQVVAPRSLAALLFQPKW